MFSNHQALSKMPTHLASASMQISATSSLSRETFCTATRDPIEIADLLKGWHRQARRGNQASCIIAWRRQRGSAPCCKGGGSAGGGRRDAHHLTTPAMPPEPRQRPVTILCAICTRHLLRANSQDKSKAAYISLYARQALCCVLLVASSTSSGVQTPANRAANAAHALSQPSQCSLGLDLHKHGHRCAEA